jgi:hypothetical protein
VNQNRGSHFPAAGLLFVFLLTFAALSPVTAQISARSIYGSWKIERVIPSSNIQTSVDDAKKYVGVEIVYAGDEFRFGGEVIGHPRYKTGRMTAAVFYEQYRAQLKELGVTRGAVSTVEVLDEKGEAVLNPGAIVFVKSADLIVTVWDGVYFEVRRETGVAPGRVR